MSIINSIFNATRLAVRNSVPPSFWPRGRTVSTYVAPPPPSVGPAWELNGGGGDWQLNGAGGDWELNT